MGSQVNRRKFMKYGIIGASSFLAAATAPVTVDMSQGFTISEGQSSVKLGVAEAQAACGGGLGCSGGGGRCGDGLGCSGGGGRCGDGLNCSGGGGRCGDGLGCAGS